MCLSYERTGQTIDEPPEDTAKSESLMGNRIDFIHADDGFDPLLRMAITHHQFESIHPSYDGNGRTAAFSISSSCNAKDCSSCRCFT